MKKLNLFALLCLSSFSFDSLAACLPSDPVCTLMENVDFSSIIEGILVILPSLVTIVVIGLSADYLMSFLESSFPELANAPNSKSVSKKSFSRSSGSGSGSVSSRPRRPRRYGLGLDDDTLPTKVSPSDSDDRCSLAAYHKKDNPKEIDIDYWDASNPALRAKSFDEWEKGRASGDNSFYH